jgi:hypothetical protein
VLEQTFQDWEHVIVNDGGEREVIDYIADFYKAQYAGRLSVIHNECSRGMEAASNIGIHASDSKYIVIHDDDDSWSPDFLQVMVSSLSHSILPSIKGAVSFTNQIAEQLTGLNTVTESIEPYFPIKSPLISFGDMLRANRFPPIAFMYERDHAAALGFYDETFPVLGDWDFNVRFMQQADIMVVPRYLAYYHVRKTGSQQNTLTAGRELHERYTVMLRNRWIRTGLTPLQTESDFPSIAAHIDTHVNVLNTALHNMSLTIGNIQKQEDIIYQRVENIERASCVNITGTKVGRKRWIHGLRSLIAGRIRHRNS